MSFVGLFTVGRPEPWMANAACNGKDPDEFFPGKNECATYAKRICSECPVSHDCLEFALLHNEVHGIWGGLAPKERQLLKRTQRGKSQPGYCGNGHDLTVRGVGSDGGCKQCHRDRWYRYEDRRRRGLAPPRKRDRRGGPA